MVIICSPMAYALVAWDNRRRLWIIEYVSQPVTPHRSTWNCPIWQSLTTKSLRCPASQFLLESRRTQLSVPKCSIVPISRGRHAEPLNCTHYCCHQMGNGRVFCRTRELTQYISTVAFRGNNPVKRHNTWQSKRKPRGKSNYNHRNAVIEN